MLTVSADTMDNNRSRSNSENNGVLVTPTGSFSETTPLQPDQQGEEGTADGPPAAFVKTRKPDRQSHGA